MQSNKYLTLAFLCATLSACGGGDGDDVAQPPPPPAPAPALPTVVGGTAKLLAGSPTNVCGLQDGIGAAALLGSDGAITVRDGKLWLADSGCSRSQASVRSIDTETGATSTLAVRPPLVSGAPLPGFVYPTGIAVDSEANVFVADGLRESDRMGVTITTPAPGPGAARGIWRVTHGAMAVHAGVQSDGRSDGKGTSAGFGQISGMVVNDDDSLVVNDFGFMRLVSPDATVTTAGGHIYRGLTPPTLVDGKAHGLRSDGVLQNVNSGLAYSTANPMFNIVLVDRHGNTYYGTPSTAGSVTSIYRKARHATERVAVVEGIQNLQSAALDEDGVLYLKQGNAVVKVTWQAAVPTP